MNTARTSAKSINRKYTAGKASTNVPQHPKINEYLCYMVRTSKHMRMFFFIRYHDFGFSTTLEFSDSTCTLVGDDAMKGSEDIVMLGLSLLLVFEFLT
jgi:hypothetical protein